MRPITSMIVNPPQFVSELIDHTSASWREDMIRDIFIPLDAEAIIKIPLCTRIVDDFWAWHEDTKGKFSVRSAYKMIVKMKLGREAWLEEREDASNTTAESKAWTSLWSIPIPSKIRVFAWRLAQQSLPTTEVLQHEIWPQPVCALCAELLIAGDML